jgi:hypothetical protein
MLVAAPAGEMAGGTVGLKVARWATNKVVRSAALWVGDSVALMDRCAVGMMAVSRGRQMVVVWVDSSV